MRSLWASVQTIEASRVINYTISTRLCVAMLMAAWGLITPLAAQVAQAPAAGAPMQSAPMQSQELPRRVAIRFLTEGDFPPFNYLDEDGVLTGFNVDIARAICLELNAACDIQVRPWGEMFALLRKGEADAVIASHAVSTSALRQVDFTEPYYYTPGRFAGKRGGAQLAVTPEGLDGKKIAVGKGTAHEAYLRVFFRDSTIQAFDNIELARDALVTGTVDFLFDDGLSLVFWLNGTASKACCEFKGGPFVEPKYFGDGIGIAVAKNDPELKSLLNAAIKRLRESGRQEELLLRYFPLRAY
jgi:polar amino acid transport system substrate-binding protein